MSETLRIGLVIDDSLDRPDGVQQYVLTLGGWLESQGHQVHYLTASTTRTDLTNLHNVGRTVAVRFNGNTLGTPLPVSRQAADQLLGSLDLDVVHVQMPYSPLLAGRVIDAAATRGVPLVGTFLIYPESWLVSFGARVLGWAERRRLGKFHRVLALSEAAQGFAQRAFRLDTEVVGSPVDTARFAAAAAAADAVAPATATPRIVFLGRLVTRKGPRQLLHALAELHRTHPDRAWRAVLAGRGPLLGDLIALAAKLGIADRVEFPGFVAEADKAGLLARADVVVLPSTGGESFGISVVEALAASAGVVLAGDNPGYRTVMRGLESQLVLPDDVARFAGSLLAALDTAADPERRTSLVKAQQQAAQRFDLDRIGGQILAVYQEAITQGR